MQEGAASVYVVLLMTHQQPGGQSVNDDSGPGGPGHRAAVQCNRIAQFADALGQNRPHRHQQYHGI